MSILSSFYLLISDLKASYTLKMRTETEVKLLGIRQRLVDARMELAKSPVVNIQFYRHLAVRLSVCQEMLVECRKHALNEAGKNRRGIK